MFTVGNYITICLHTEHHMRSNTGPLVTSTMLEAVHRFCTLTYCITVYRITIWTELNVFHKSVFKLHVEGLLQLSWNFV